MRIQTTMPTVYAPAVGNDMVSIVGGNEYVVELAEQNVCNVLLNGCKVVGR